jgi:hypothetical protein
MISPAFLDASMATCRIWSRSASSVPSWTVVVVEADIWIGATRGRINEEEKEGEWWKAGDVTKDFTTSPQSTRRRIDDRRITDGQENLIVTYCRWQVFFGGFFDRLVWFLDFLVVLM